MKKVGVLFILLLWMLTGCFNADGQLERGMALRSSVLKASSITFDAHITADYGDKIHMFDLSCAADQKGTVQFEVAAPETIQGITGTVQEGSGLLTFDEAALHFPSLADGQIIPVMAPWILMNTLRSGYITSGCMEDDLLHLTIDDSYEEDALHLDIWLDESNLPVRAEVLYDDRRILTLDVKNFVFL